MFAGFVARMEDTRLPKCVMFGQLVRGLEKETVDGVSPGGPQSFWYQRRPPGRGGMAQDGGTKGGTFNGEMDRCRESQGWATACSSMLERDDDGKGHGEDRSPK